MCLDWLIDWLIDSFIHSFIHLLTDWLTVFDGCVLPCYLRALCECTSYSFIRELRCLWPLTPIKNVTNRFQVMEYRRVAVNCIPAALLPKALCKSKICTKIVFGLGTCWTSPQRSPKLSGENILSPFPSHTTFCKLFSSSLYVSHACIRLASPPPQK